MANTTQEFTGISNTGQTLTSYAGGFAKQPEQLPLAFAALFSWKREFMARSQPQINSQARPLCRWDALIGLQTSAQGAMAIRRGRADRGPRLPAPRGMHSARGAAGRAFASALYGKNLIIGALLGCSPPGSPLPDPWALPSGPGHGSCQQPGSDAMTTSAGRC